jgi:hypothetical protein
LDTVLDRGATTSAGPKCDATNTKVGVTEWGTVGIPCQATVGLRSHLDASGRRRYYCPAPAHKATVIRRYGRAVYDGMENDE